MVARNKTARVRSHLAEADSANLLGCFGLRARARAMSQSERHREVRPNVNVLLSCPPQARSDLREPLSAIFIAAKIVGAAEPAPRVRRRVERGPVWSRAWRHRTFGDPAPIVARRFTRAMRPYKKRSTTSISERASAEDPKDGAR
jgi:hypothetical protein